MTHHMLLLDDVTLVRHGQGFGPFDLRVDPGERVALLGPIQGDARDAAIYLSNQACLVSHTTLVFLYLCSG